MRDNDEMRGTLCENNKRNLGYQNPNYIRSSMKSLQKTTFNYTRFQELTRIRKLKELISLCNKIKKIFIKLLKYAL